MKTARTWIAALTLALAGSSAFAHGDMAPQAVDTHTLPKLGEKALETNPYAVTGSNPTANGEAVRIGSSAYNANCARCHGLEAKSGGIAPDLRKLNADCGDMKKPDKACMAEMDQYFYSTVMQGRTRDGRVYMPPFKEIFTQEAVWAIRSYVDTRQPD
jgi:cytochrome c-550 PedF